MRQNYDFSRGKRGAVISDSKKERITIRLDSRILKWFKAEVGEGGNYQTLLNTVLLDFVSRDGESTEAIIRRIIREELRRKNMHHSKKHNSRHSSRSSHLHDRKSA